MNSKVIAVDFDGVLHKYSRGWFDGTIYDEPTEGAVDKMTLLTKQGFQMVVFTTRKPKMAVENWLDRYGIPYHEVTNEKPMALAYIDDRAIRFTNWEDIVKYFI